MSQESSTFDPGSHDGGYHARRWCTDGLLGPHRKGYRLLGSDLTPEFSPAECGVNWTLHDTKDCRGKAAALNALIRQKVVTLRFADNDAVVYGWEPVLTAGLTGQSSVIGRIAGGEYGYNVGAFIAHAFLDADAAVGAGRREHATPLLTIVRIRVGERLRQNLAMYRQHVTG